MQDGPADLAAYDVILVNSSAGKDSQAMLTHLVALADAQQLDRARLIVVHADLGRVEWEGTRELAQEQAEHYGLRFEVVRREKGDLLGAEVGERGAHWGFPFGSVCRERFRLMVKPYTGSPAGRQGLGSVDAGGARSSCCASASATRWVSMACESLPALLLTRITS